MTTYIAICFGYWGRGKTDMAALTQLRKAGGKAKDFKVIYRNDHEASQDKPYVDDCGTICYHGTLTKITEIKNGKRKELV